MSTSVTPAAVVGQRRRSPGGQVVVLSRVDYEQGLVWGHRESDGYKLAKGEGVPVELLEDWPVVGEAMIVLRYADTPPSINDPKSGYKATHWGPGHTMKKRWHKIFESLLLVQRAKLPRAPAAYVRCSAKLVFVKPPRGGTRRDPENYRVVLSKALADALVKVGVIKDDSGTQFQLERVDIEVGERAETVVEISWPET